MKKSDIIIYLTNKKEKSNFSIISLFINCIMSIFSLCFVVDIFCFFHVLVNDALLEKFLFVIMCGLALTFIAALRFSFFSFVKSLAEKYNLLLILGIKTKDFWKLAGKEYFSKVFFLGIKAILISNTVCTVISYIVFYNNSNINIIMAIKQFLSTVILVFLLFVMILLVTMIDILYNRSKKGLIDFFEQFSQDLLKGNKSERENIWISILGISFLILSFILLIDFRVEKMILAIFLNIFGIFLIIHTAGQLIKKIIKKLKNIYYKKILIWSDLIFQYKINSHLIFILYTLNFFLVYFMGGLIVSVDSGQDFTTKYPYETIIYSDSNICPQNSYHTLLVNITGYGSVIAISNDDYNHLTKTESNLRQGEVLFLDEREKEADLPLEEKEIEVINKRQDEKHFKYNVKNTEWKVIFGQNIFRELNGVMVFDDKDFALLSDGKLGVEKFICLSKQAIDLDKDSLKLSGEAEYWNRAEQVAKERIENKVIITLIYMISLILILEGQAFIFTKQIVNLKEESYRYDVLKQLGIKRAELGKMIEKKIKGILLIPGVLAIMSGIIFFGMDIYQNSSGITLLLLLNYGIVIFIFAFIQISGCYFISRKIKKIYMYEF